LSDTPTELLFPLMSLLWLLPVLTTLLLEVDAFMLLPLFQHLPLLLLSLLLLPLLLVMAMLVP